MKNLHLVVTLAVAMATAAVVVAAASPGAAEVSNEAQVLVENELQYLPDEDGVPKLTVPETRQSLTLGTVGPDDRLLARITHSVAAAVFVVQNQDITFRGVEHTNITAIQVTRTGTTTNAVPTVVAGGLGYTFVTINILGRRDQGYAYTINVYSSINCSNS